MKLKRVIAKVLLGSMIISFTAPFATINSYSYSVDTTYEDTTEKYEENIAVSIEPLEVPTVGVARYMMPFITEEATDLVTTEIETTEKEEELLVVYTTEYLNVRQEADQEAKKINTLPPNTELRNVTRVNNSWYSFDFEEQLDIAEQLYGQHIKFHFSANTIQNFLETENYYPADVKKRVSDLLLEQRRKYQYLFS